jgi:hypothetical protein
MFEKVSNQEISFRRVQVEYYPVKEDGSTITEEDDIFVDDPDTLVSVTITRLLVFN